MHIYSKLVEDDGSIMLNAILNFIVQFLSNPTILIALIVMVGLIIQRKSAADTMKGTIKTIVGFGIISAGAGVVIGSLTPLDKLMAGTFDLSGTLPVNESAFAVASAKFGAALSGIMAIALVVNVIQARFSKFKFIYLTGHEIMWVSTVCAISLNAINMPLWQIIISGGLLTGTYMAVFPALIYKSVCKVTGTKDLAIGHSGTVFYWLAMIVGRLTGNKEKSAEDIKISKSWNVLRDLTVSLTLAMVIVYIAVSILSMIQAPDLAKETFAGTNFIIFSIMHGAQFAVAIYLIQAGVRMVVGELVPAFKGVAEKFIPDAIPALDIPILYPYQPNSVLIGFISATVGGLAAFFVQILLIGTIFELPLILPTLFTAFFYGATAGCLCNQEGGLRGVIIGSVFTGFTIALFPALLIKFGKVFVEGTTFGGGDSAIIGIFNTQIGGFISSFGLFIVIILLSLAPIVWSVMTSGRPGITERNISEGK
ncbi:MAG: putative integral rane protein [Neobacillus sp.]|nr:putative integral rane protein [Neobacillus sp.]